jgi:hypothetical protein
MRLTLACSCKVPRLSAVSWVCNRAVWDVTTVR